MSPWMVESETIIACHCARFNIKANCLFVFSLGRTPCPPHVNIDWLHAHSCIFFTNWMDRPNFLSSHPLHITSTPRSMTKEPGKRGREGGTEVGGFEGFVLCTFTSQWCCRFGMKEWMKIMLFVVHGWVDRASYCAFEVRLTSVFIYQWCMTAPIVG